MYDAIIIGAGPAGLSAAIYLVRKKVKTLVLASELGGQAAKSAEIENYLGFTKISGVELSQKFSEHAEALGVEIKMGEVQSIVKADEGFEIKTEDELYQAKSVLMAAGKMPARLNIHGEEDFIGKGISFCATCDGPLFANKTVTVIGGGNSALDAALELEKYANKVYMINLNAEFQGDEVRKDRVKESKKIEVISQAKTKDFFGEMLLKGIKYETEQGEIKEIATDGVFIEIGWVPATSSVKGLVDLNQIKEIKIDLENHTNVPGIYAAGDITDVAEKQIIIAAGEGAKAALNLWKYLITSRKL